MSDAFLITPGDCYSADGKPMPLQILAGTQQILEDVDAEMRPLVEFELADRLSNVLSDDGLTSEERKGASAEWAAFFFRELADEDAGPWNTHYGPTLTMFLATRRANLSLMFISSTTRHLLTGSGAQLQQSIP